MRKFIDFAVILTATLASRMMDLTAKGYEMIGIIVLVALTVLAWIFAFREEKKEDEKETANHIADHMNR